MQSPQSRLDKLHLSQSKSRSRKEGKLATPIPSYLTLGSVHTFRRGARERKSCLKVFPFMRSVVGGILQSLSAVLGEHKSGLIRKELLRGMTRP